jgi:outer membrane lipoprotein-sorting protein
MRRIALSFLAVTIAGSAWAGPKDAVHDAYAKLLAAKSFRATVTDVKNGEQLSELEFVAPNRYRMHSSKGPETIIVGDDAWMNMNGQLMKMPIPVGKIIGQYRNEAMLHQSDLSVTDLGADSVGGEAAHKYGYTITEPMKADVKLWIDDKTGLPLQIESQGSFMGRASNARIHYSNFNDPSIAIDAP